MDGEKDREEDKDGEKGMNGGKWLNGVEEKIIEVEE